MKQNTSNLNFQTAHPVNQSWTIAIQSQRKLSPLFTALKLLLIRDIVAQIPNVKTLLQYIALLKLNI
jgi:hypothetical protein